MKKNIFQKYIDYINDNPNRYWFKRKIYGWGWTPATWEGWLTLAVFISLIFLNAVRLDAVTASADYTVGPFLIQTVLLVVVLLIVCYKKGESPRWQWGIKGKDTDSETPSQDTPNM
jgi:hypothetical protein